MENSLRLRKATNLDVPIFARIKAEAYADDRQKTQLTLKDKPSWYDGEWYVGLGIINEEEAKRLINEQECYMILVGNTIIGGLWIMNEQEDSLTLEDFCILPENQGRGYGTRVLSLLEDTHKGNKVWKLDTPKFCERNRHLYEKLGYIQVGMVSNDTVVLYEKHIR